jgi:Tol biopolymer transport system component
MTENISPPVTPSLPRARLDSWKAIAAHLQRDVTTVRRWEKREHLPVHRHVHDKLGSVYAYVDEVDEWWQQRSTILQHDNGRAPSVDDDPASPPPLPGRWRQIGIPVLVGIVATGVLSVVLLTTGVTDATPSSRVARLELSLPDEMQPRTLSVSPDGRYVAFTSGTDSNVWIRPLDSFDPQPLHGTRGASFPFWSRDSRSLGFFADGKLKSIRLETRAIRELADAPDGRGGTWNNGDRIVFAPARGRPLLEVSASGGPVRTVTVLAGENDRGHVWPHFLPDGYNFVYLDNAFDAKRHGLYVGDLGGSPPRQLVRLYTNAEYVEPGHLLYVGDRGLVAHRFDVRRLQFVGEPVLVAAGVLQQAGIDHKGDFSVSGTGVLAFREAGDERSRLVWIDRAGREMHPVAEPARYSSPALSPDGRRVAITRFDPDDRSGNADVWMIDVASAVTSRFTFERGLNFFPLWSPDGARVLFASNRNGSIDFYERLAAGGADRRVLSVPKITTPESWSSDGRVVTFSTVSARTASDVWGLDLTGDGRPYPILQGRYNEGQSQISPDGRYLAYASDESGHFEVYVRRLRSNDTKWQISTTGGADPRWSHDGRELFYISSNRRLTAVDVRTETSFEMGGTHPLFDTHIDELWEDARNHFDVSADGQRFLLVQPLADSRSLPITVLVNWRPRR